MNLLEDDERREVERLAQEFPEIQNEILAIEDVLALYAQSKAIPVPQTVKQQILHRIEELEEEKIEKPKPWKTNFVVWGQYLFFAGLAIYLILRNLLLFSDLSSIQTELKNQQLFNDSIQQDNDSLNQRLFDQANLLEKVLNRNSQRVLLHAQSSQKNEDLAAVYYNPVLGQVLLDPIKLGAPPANKQYQLWAMHGHHPTSLGIFTIHEGIVQMKFHPGIDAFAISIEDKGPEKHEPDLKAIYFLGEVD